MKILYNTCYGGFGFSHDFINEFNRRYPEEEPINSEHDEERRSDPKVIQLFEIMGSSLASGHYASLNVKTIPDGVQWSVSEYDGMERIKWDIPKDEIIRELIDIVKGRKTEPTNQFTKRLLDEDLRPYALYSKLMEETKKD